MYVQIALCLTLSLFCSAARIVKRQIPTPQLVCPTNNRISAEACDSNLQCRSLGNICYAFPFSVQTLYYCCPTQASLAGSPQTYPNQPQTQTPQYPFQQNFGLVNLPPNGVNSPDSPRFVVKTAPGDMVNYVKDQIRRNPVMIFSKTSCSHCTEAKQMLRAQGFTYSDIDVERISNGESMLNAVQSLTGVRAVPQIFVCGWFIEGSSNLSRNLATGYFQTLHQQCASQNAG